MHRHHAQFEPTFCTHSVHPLPLCSMTYKHSLQYNFNVRHEWLKITKSFLWSSLFITSLVFSNFHWYKMSAWYPNIDYNSEMILQCNILYYPRFWYNGTDDLNHLVSINVRHHLSYIFHWLVIFGPTSFAADNRTLYRPWIISLYIEPEYIVAMVIIHHLEYTANVFSGRAHS